MIRHTVMIVLCLSLSASASFAQDDVMDKIRLLEQQIQELKALREQQAVSAVKYEDCMKAIAREKFCRCVGDSLPHDVSFELYVNTLVTSRDKLGYSTMTGEQKKTVDATIETREKCIEKGFFK